MCVCVFVCMYVCMRARLAKVEGYNHYTAPLSIKKGQAIDRDEPYTVTGW